LHCSSNVVIRNFSFYGSSFSSTHRAPLLRNCNDGKRLQRSVTHWTSADLARQAMADGVVKRISASMIRRILQTENRHPYRMRYWKTRDLDDEFKARAEKILWCYGNVERLAGAGYWVVCVDEMLNFQILERHPIRKAIPGSIEQREFDYIRHGTVNLLMFLTVHTGRMLVVCL
jgi:hypothetical protein